MKEKKDELIEAFSKSLPIYLSDVDTTSGKLFYSITWNQIAEHLNKENPLRMLDIGCGFGLTSIWLSEQGHLVTGMDITPDMIQAAEQKANEKRQEIRFLQGDLESVDNTLKGETFDWIICHNVLGYLDQPKHAIEKLKTLLNPKGCLSIVVHNPAAKVLTTAIVDRDVKGAKEKIKEEGEFNPLIGTYVYQYPTTTYVRWFKESDLDLMEHYGIRCVFDYIQQSEEEKNQSIHFKDFLDLELKLGKQSPYREIAFFYHFIVQNR